MLTIGSLAKKTGTKVQTIRYYEQIGLMPEPGRTGGGQRRYGDAELDRLSFIRHSRQLGFPLDVIRELLDLSDHPDKSCDEADAIARRQLKQVEQRLARLRLQCFLTLKCQTLTLSILRNRSKTDFFKK